MYVVSTLLTLFLFEQPFDLRILLDFFWIWFYLRFFMPNNEGQIGDLTHEFALASFFPQRLQGPISAISEVSFAIFNMCGFVNWLRARVAGRRYDPVQRSESATELSTPERPKTISKLPTTSNNQPLSIDKKNSSTEKKKAALDYLDEQIKQFAKTSNP